MNYLNFLREMQETHAVALFSSHPGWCIQVTKFDYTGNGFDNMSPEFQVVKDTPESAICAAYLLVNPIKKEVK